MEPIGYFRSIFNNQLFDGDHKDLFCSWQRDNQLLSNSLLKCSELQVFRASLASMELRANTIYVEK